MVLAEWKTRLYSSIADENHPTLDSLQKIMPSNHFKQINTFILVSIYIVIIITIFGQEFFFFTVYWVYIHKRLVHFPKQAFEA